MSKDGSVCLSLPSLESVHVLNAGVVEKLDALLLVGLQGTNKTVTNFNLNGKDDVLQCIYNVQRQT